MPRPPRRPLAALALVMALASTTVGPVSRDSAAVLLTAGIRLDADRSLVADTRFTADTLLVAGAIGQGVDVPSRECRRPWSAPVDAPVADPFRPPERPYGPGNRGVEFRTEPGQPVWAVGDGLVTFAGPVAGAPVVVIDHGSGLRSSSVHLFDRLVEAGQAVTRGQQIGTADAGFHLGARLHDRYVDPAELLDRRCVAVRLVPLGAG